MMRMTIGAKRAAGVAAVMAMTGSLAALLPSCETTLKTVNPCGSIFGFCEPTDIDRMFAEPVADYELDPTCTIPYYGVDNPDNAGDCTQVPVWPSTPGPRPDF